MIIQHNEKKYQVIKELGRGHTGSVFLATDPHGQKVAIKCLTRQYNDAALKRFQREFIILHSLVHSNIAQPFDFGFDPRIKRYFFVAEYVEGISIQHAFKGLEDKKRLKLLAQALKALDYIHRNGVYHCDLKPANVLVTGHGILKLIDFDVASRGTLTIGGTPPFLPPELVINLRNPPNPRTDLYSLGVTFYQCLTGHKPYPAKTLNELKRMHARIIPKFPSELNPQIEPHWDGLLMGMLQKNPSQRFSTASAVLQQVMLLLGAKKDFLSVEDIEYRLSQHGIPIGKEGILEKTKEILQKNLSKKLLQEQVWVLQGETGSGTTYLLEEIKNLSQLSGVPVIHWNQYQQNYPESEPYTWLIDDFEKMQQSLGKEKALELTHKLREPFLKRASPEGWIVLGGIQDNHSIPRELRTLMKGKLTTIRLATWGPREHARWMEDIFQTSEIPLFLKEKIFELSSGNPKKSNILLNQFLEKELILDLNGHWRKDLFRPTSLFLEQFHLESPRQDFARHLKKYSKLEQQLLKLLCVFREPIPGELLEKLNPHPELYPSLSRLAVQRVISQEGLDLFQISNPSFKNFLINQLSPKELLQKHDLLVGRSDLYPYLSTQELHYHMSRGSDPGLAAQGWAFFGEDCALKGLWESAFEYYSNAFDKTPKEQFEKKFEYSVAKGKCLIQRNLLRDAREFFKSLLTEFEDQRLKRPEIFAKIYERLGVIETKLGNLEKAKEQFHQGLLCLSPKFEPLEQYLAIRNFLAGLELQLGNVETAIQEYRDTFEVAQAKLPFERRRILTNNDLGAALLKAGRYEEAIEHWTHLIEDLKGREDRNPLARAYFQIGQAYWAQNLEKEALKYFLLAQEEGKDLQNFDLNLRIYNSLANIYRGKEPEKSLVNYEKALDAAFNISDYFSTAVVLLNMGFLLETQGQFPRAKHCLEQGLIHLKESGVAEEKLSPLLHSAYLTLTRCCNELLQIQEALGFAKKAQQVLEECSSLQGEKFETLLASWQALLLNQQEEEAQLLLKELKLLAVSPEKKQMLKIERERSSELLKQLASSRGHPIILSSTRSTFSHTQSTLSLPDPDQALSIDPLR